MKKRILPLAAALALTATAIGTAKAGDDYSRIPATIRASIKAKCVAEYPGDYGMQNGCIIVQSHSYLAVHDYAPPPPDPDGIDFAADEVEFYLEVAALEQALLTTCGPSARADAADIAAIKREARAHLSKREVRRIFGDALTIQLGHAKRDRKWFCDPTRQLVAE